MVDHAGIVLPLRPILDGAASVGFVEPSTFVLSLIRCCRLRSSHFRKGGDHVHHHFEAARR